MNLFSNGDNNAIGYEKMSLSELFENNIILPTTKSNSTNTYVARDDTCPKGCVPIVVYSNNNNNNTRVLHDT